MDDAIKKSKDMFLDNLPTYKRRRIFEIDFIRGLCIILMLFDHVTYLAGYTFGIPWYGRTISHGMSAGADFALFSRWYWTSAYREIGHPVVLFFFFSISGISCYLSRSNLKRGLVLTAVSALYSIATYILQTQAGLNGTLVSFGVLNMLAVCIMMFVGITALSRLISKNRTVSKWIACGVFAALTLTIVLMYYYYIPPKNTPIWLFFLFPPGYFFTQAQVSPGDFFPMIPYSAFFFFGAAIAPILYGKKRTLFPYLDRAWHRPISFIGRYTLIIYLSHIVILTMIFALIGYLFITPGDWLIF
jgi:uncharacterized membrane protein